MEDDSVTPRAGWVVKASQFFVPLLGAMTHLVGEESMDMMRKAVGSGFRPHLGAKATLGTHSAITGRTR